MTGTQTPEREYVPPDSGGKKRMSRGRKALIGLVVTGAVAAAAGGGTFASFTASTDNAAGDTPFTATNDMLLGNTVRNGALSSTQCLSDDSDGVSTPLGGGATNAVVCEVLFEASQLDGISTAAASTDLILENLSGTGNTGILHMASLGCTGAALCDNLEIDVQEYAVGGVRGDENTTQNTDFLTPVPLVPLINTGHPVTDPVCVFPRELDAPCASSTAASADQRVNDLPTSFSTTTVIDSAFPPSLADNNDGTRFFRITVRLVGDVVCDTDGLLTPGDSTDDDDNPTDGVIDETGQGCSNGATGTAQFTLRWVLEEA